MAVINRTIERIRLETRIRILEVVAAGNVTPLMRRIRLGGPELQGFQSPGHADHIRLFLPSDGKPIPRPEQRPDGLAFADDVPRPFIREYTPRHFDPVGLTLDLDFVLHGDGPASTWAAGARPGDSVMIGGPRGSIRVPETFDWYFLAGDETALPALGRRIEELPAGARAMALIEIAGAEERQHFHTAANVDIHWLERNGRPAGMQDMILPATAATTFPPGLGFAFVAGEAAMAKAMKAHLIEQRGFSPDFVRAAGYWLYGEAAH